MIYKVKARFLKDKASEFYQKLVNGTISNQKPDGDEIVASMKKARITQPGVINWYETCYCPTPLQHERETVYNHYLSDIKTEEAEGYGEVKGESFWEYLKNKTD